MGIKLGRSYYSDFHNADSPVPGSRMDHDGRLGLHGNQLPIQLKLCLRLTLEYQIGFRGLSMIVGLGIQRDVRDMQRVGNRWAVQQGATSHTTRALKRSDRRKIDDFEARLLAQAISIATIRVD